MPNTNVCAASSFSGNSDAVRHRFTPANPESEAHRINRQISWVNDARQLVEDWEQARAAGKVKYVNRTKDIR